MGKGAIFKKYGKGKFFYKQKRVFLSSPFLLSREKFFFFKKHHKKKHPFSPWGKKKFFSGGKTPFPPKKKKRFWGEYIFLPGGKKKFFSPFLTPLRGNLKRGKGERGGPRRGKGGNFLFLKEGFGKRAFRFWGLLGGKIFGFLAGGEKNFNFLKRKLIFWFPPKGVLPQKGNPSPPPPSPKKNPPPLILFQKRCFIVGSFSKNPNNPPGI